MSAEPSGSAVKVKPVLTLLLPHGFSAIGARLTGRRLPLDAERLSYTDMLPAVVLGAGISGECNEGGPPILAAHYRRLSVALSALPALASSPTAPSLPSATPTRAPASKRTR